MRWVYTMRNFPKLFLFVLLFSFTFSSAVFADESTNQKTNESTSSEINTPLPETGPYVEIKTGGDISSVFVASSTYGPYNVRPTSAGQYGGFTVSLNSGVSSFLFYNYKVYGLHSNEKASIKWTVTDASTGEERLSWVEGDVTSYKTFGVYGLPSGKTYDVNWVSLNDNDVVGGTYVQVDGYAYQ